MLKGLLTITTKRIVQGIVLSVGAPLGWLVLEWFAGVSPKQSIHLNVPLYTYLLFGTMAVFILYGLYIGRQEAYIASLALNDSLTGIYNVRYYKARMQEEMLKANRHEKPLALVVFDLDHFKQVNDNHGHQVGDKVLVQVAQTVKALLRKYDVFARVGGEEFAIILPDCPSHEAQVRAESLRLAINRLSIDVDAVLSLVVTASFGVTQYKTKESERSFIERADKALYEAKKQGRNNTIVF